MTDFLINDDEAIKKYTASAGQTDFQGTFQIFVESDFNMYLTPAGQDPDPALDLLALNVDYTVAYDSTTGYFTVTLTTPASAGDLVTLERDLPTNRTRDYKVGGDFTGASINQQLDKLTMLQQQTNSLIEQRGLTYRVTDTLADGDITLPKLEANQHWRKNATGTAIQGVEFEEDPGATTLRSELIDKQSGSAGSTIVGYYSAVNGQTTVSDELDYVETSVLPTILPTGIMWPFIGTVAPAGWVKLDDGTIGSASSGATTRANADTEDLFKLLWNSVSDAYAPVPGGRGATADIDWNANKQITLPAMLGRAMGIAGSGSGLTARALGQTLGEEEHTLTKAEIPPHVHTYTEPTGSRNLSEHDVPTVYQRTTGVDTGDGSADGLAGDAHNNMQPTVFVNMIIKL